MYGTEVTFLMTSKLFFATNNMLNFDHRERGKLKNFSQQEERGEIEELFGEELAAGRYDRGARV
jgi:hypothetical protein